MADGSQSVSRDFFAAGASAIGLLTAASESLHKSHGASADGLGRDDLHAWALDAFATAGYLLNLLNIDPEAVRTVAGDAADPFICVSRAHDVLLAQTAEMSISHVQMIVIEIGSLRQQLRRRSDCL